MSEEIERKQNKISKHAFNRDLERKALDRSVARDKLIQSEEEENNKQDD